MVRCKFHISSLFNYTNPSLHNNVDALIDFLSDRDNVHGENLASNNGSGSWAGVRSVDSIVTREFEWEQLHLYEIDRD